MNEEIKNNFSKKIICVLILIIIFFIVGIGLLFYFNKNKQTDEIIKSDLNVSNQLYKDLEDKKISVDEYVKYHLYAEYDRDLLKDEYKNLELSNETIDIEYLINNHYDELSQETIKFFAKKINLENITFELDKENEKTSQDSSWLDLFLLKVSAKEEKVTNLNQVILSSSGNFVIWYTTTGDSGIDFKTAKEIADGLESTVKKFESFFGYDYSSEAEIFSEGKTYQNQIKILNNVNIDSNYLKTATQVYLVNYNESSLAQYVSGYGKGKEIINSIFGGDDYGSIVFPYIIIKPSSFSDSERLAQLYNHELFHHYQRHILCGHSNCTLSKDLYYQEATANWASALVTTKTTNEGFLNEWASVPRRNSNSLLKEYVEKYGETNASYAMFVYLYNYSSNVNDGRNKIKYAMYQEKFLEYLEANSTTEERSKLQKQIALKNLTNDYLNKNINVSDEKKSVDNIKDIVNIKNNDSINDIIVEKMGISYYKISIPQYTAVKIGIDRKNNGFDSVLVAVKDNKYLVLYSSVTSNEKIEFNTNDYDIYEDYYLIIYNNYLTTTSEYSLSLIEVTRDEPRPSTWKFIYPVIDCELEANKNVKDGMTTFFVDEDHKIIGISTNLTFYDKKTAQQEYEKANKDFKSNSKVLLRDEVKLSCVKRLENYPHLKTYQDVLDYYEKVCGYRQ